ncbi:MAG TPA: hypothetical protein PK525_04325 [Anaerohalosphaeraceae bacterium]|nr:hypothetical protein [Anaerohalosphaeraceae bacterium]
MAGKIVRTSSLKMGKDRTMKAGKENPRKLTKLDRCVLIGLVGTAVFLLVPPLIQAGQEKKLSKMVDRLQIIRSQISLYKADHNGLLPGQSAPGQSICPEDILLAMMQSRPNGSGPYLRQIPENPYLAETGRGTMITCVNDPNAQPTGAEGTGWWFNAATGQWKACDSEFHANY